MGELSHICVQSIKFFRAVLKTILRYVTIVSCLLPVSVSVSPIARALPERNREKILLMKHRAHIKIGKKDEGEESN
jgi:hypothetical protein